MMHIMNNGQSFFKKYINITNQAIYNSNLDNIILTLWLCVATELAGISSVMYHMILCFLYKDDDKEFPLTTFKL